MSTEPLAPEFAPFGAFGLKHFGEIVLQKVAQWVGHAEKSITDLYAEGSKNGRTSRHEWCEPAGLGFSVGLYGAIKKCAASVAAGGVNRNE